MFTALIKNKSILVLLGGLLILSYLYIKIYNLEIDILNKDIKIEKLNNNLNISTSNTKKCTDTIRDNIKVINNYQMDIKKVENYYIKIIQKKNTLIDVLRDDIIELKKPVKYAKEVIYKKCIVKIKTIKDIKDEDKVFNSIINIGN